MFVLDILNCLKDKLIVYNNKLMWGGNKNMKIFLNEKKSNDFIKDRNGRIRTPMYFESLSDNAKSVYKVILSYGRPEFEIESIDGIMKEVFNDAIMELCENDYLNIFGNKNP